MKIKFKSTMPDKMEEHLKIIEIDANEKGKGLVTTKFSRSGNIFELELTYSVPMGDRMLNWFAKKEMQKAIRGFDKDVKFL